MRAPRPPPPQLRDSRSRLTSGAMKRSTPGKKRMLHADAAEPGLHGPSASTAKTLPAEDAPTPTDVARTARATTKQKKKARKKSRKIRKRSLLLLAAPLPMLAFSKLSVTRAAIAVASVRHDPDLAVDLPPAIDAAVFEAASRSAKEHGFQPRRMAIADMSQPSTAKRLYIVDMDARKVVLRTWIAHGQNSGELTATKFSNRTDSHETSLGLYRVGATIASPKHGPALLLDGLDKGINDKALAREIILHGAKYVSAPFIALHGRLGRSWGCPAVPIGEMARIIELLADGGLLFVYGSPAPQNA